MAQLNNTLITGDARVTGTIYGNLSGTAAKATGDADGTNIKSNYMQASSGTKTLSWTTSTTIGKVNSADVKVALPTDNVPFSVSYGDTTVTWAAITTAFQTLRPIYLLVNGIDGYIVPVQCSGAKYSNNAITQLLFTLVCDINMAPGDPGVISRYRLSAGTGGGIDYTTLNEAHVTLADNATNAANYLSGGQIAVEFEKRVAIVQSDVVSDLNDIVTPGLYALYLQGNASGTGNPQTAHVPVRVDGTYTYGRTSMVVAKYAASSSGGDSRTFVHQILFDEEHVHIRYNSNLGGGGTWSSWKHLTAELWQGYKISVGTLSSDPTTISFV